MKKIFQLMCFIILPIIFAFIFFILVGCIEPDIKIKYNSETVFLDKTKPLYYDDENLSLILIPADILAQKFGAEVNLNSQTKIMNMKNDSYHLKLTDKSKTVYVNGIPKEAPLEVSFKDNNVFVPLRFFCDSTGKNVYWDSSSSTISIFDSHSKDLFQYKYASDFVSIDLFKMQTDKLFFYNSAPEYKLTPNYLPQRTLNPQINSQLYSIAKVVVDPEYYSKIDYNSSTNESIDSLPHAYIAVNEKNHAENNYFKFMFFDKEAVNLKKALDQKDLTSKAIIKLEINNLSLKRASCDDQDTKILEERLRLSLIAAFQENTGLNISEFINSEYKKLKAQNTKKYENYKKVRKIGNVKVNLLYGFDKLEKDTMHVYFSY